jgi:phospholipase C
MENHGWNSVIDTPSAPYQTSLVKACGALTAQAIVGSPSLPNYIGATAGQIFGIHDDASPPSHPITADNLFRQVRTAGGTSKSYQEDMSSNCMLTNGGQYAVKHNPAAYYTGADDRTACGRDNVPLGTPEQGPLADALAADALPTFAFITPNLCNDTHDCPVATGDAWLKRWVPRILSSAAYQRGDTALIVGYDEYTPMPNAWIAPSVRPGSTFTPKTDQYTLLRATEQMLGLPFLGAAATSPDVRAALNV